MKDSYSFTSQPNVTDIKFAEDISNDVISEEPMFFSSTLKFAYENGGAITKSFLDAVSSLNIDEDMIFDSRVHMLMEGWYPCIPGWHHDDIPRSTQSGQPNYDTPEYHSQHILGLVNSDICPTEFLVGNNIELPKVDDGVVYGVWNDIIETKKKSNMVIQCPDRTLVMFGCHDFHRGVKAIRGGWRWFGRVSYATDRVKTPANSIRKQVQVYLEFPTAGW